MRLHFVVPGFSKCGTTTLCALLAEHPQIAIARGKEPSFFCWNYDRGWQWYEELFDGCDGSQFCGEGSTAYTAEEYAVQSRDRMLAAFPDIKLIFIARHPIRRLESSYRQMHDVGYKFGVRPAFRIGKLLQQCPNMVNDTRYWRLIQYYRERVPDQRIHVLFLEDLQHDPRATLDRCFQFLGTDPNVEIKRAQRRLNGGESKCYDSLLMRCIRANALTSRIWQRLTPSRQDRLTQTFRLRRLFQKPVHWDPLAREIVRREVFDDTRQFIAHYGQGKHAWDLEAWDADAPQAEPADATPARATSRAA